MPTPETRAQVLRLRKLEERAARRMVEVRRGETARARERLIEAERARAAVQTRLERPATLGRTIAQLQRDERYRAAERTRLAGAEALRRKAARAQVQAETALETARRELEQALRVRQASESLDRALRREADRKRARRDQRAAEELTRPKARR
jgi:hypothetical protein